MGIDPFSQYGVTRADNEDVRKESNKKTWLVRILVVLILIILLFLSLYLIRTRTSFFNFASELTGDTISTKPPLASPQVSVTTEVATTSTTNTEISTSSATVPIATVAPTPITTPTSIEIENSYMFASPLTAATGNVEKIRVTVFILDGTGAGISGKTVTLTGVDKLAVYTIQGVSDITGRAVFDVAAGTSGSYEIGASAGGSALTQKVTVTFD